MAKDEGLKDAIAFVTTFPPRRCGIAIFADDLVRSCRQQMEGKLRPIVVALDDPQDELTYPSVVRYRAEQSARRDYVAAADFLNFNKVRAVCLQHEFGIFGGDDGAYVLDMLRDLRCPIVTTCHTLLKDPTEGQREVMEEVVEMSRRVVAMSRRGVEFLREIYGAPDKKVRFIHHGVPELPFVETDPYKGQFRLSGRTILLTAGLLSPGKGIEYVLEALPPVVKKYLRVTYIVLGATHPNIIKEQGEQYRLSLQREAAELGLQKNVLFTDQFVTRTELFEFLKAADIFITPYLHKEQITSGNLAYALAAGKPVISTAYWHAEELLGSGRGQLVGFESPKEITDALLELLRSPAKVREVRTSAYEYSRQMVWSEVARAYLQAFRESIREARTRALVVDESMRRILSLTGIPRPRLEHLQRMTDDTGLLQHACYSVPNRSYGYCTDDNSRALVATTKHYGLFRDRDSERLLGTYLSFIQYAQRQDGLFHNFMSYDRRFQDEVGSDDCFGRALWGLGYVVNRGPTPYVNLAKEIFEKALPNLKPLNLRGRAYSIIGLYYYLEQYSEAEDIRDKIEWLAEEHCKSFRADSDRNWAWFEPVISYDAAVVPHSLFLAYEVTGKEEFLETAKQALNFIIRKSWRSEHFSFAGNNGWHKKGTEPAQFDQQPIDACSFVEACKAAFRVTGEKRYLKYMRKAFDWFLGVNDLGNVLYDFKTGACSDGLTPAGPNQNMGAESTLCCLLALLTMTEIFSEQDRARLRRAARSEKASIPR